MPHLTDLNLTPKDLQGLTSADAITAFFTKLGYDTGSRRALTAEAVGLAGDAAAPIRAVELLSEDSEGFLRVMFVQLRSLTAKSRNDLARVLGRTNTDHLIVLASDFDTLEFVLLEKFRQETRGAVDTRRIQVIPRVVAVSRKAPDTRQMRSVRRLTWTGRDGLEQFDKLRNLFLAAAFSEDYFCNRALFADHYLLTRLRDDPAWAENPSHSFAEVKRLLADPRGQWLGKDEALVREQLYEPLFRLLGFEIQVNKPVGGEHTTADYLLTGREGKTAAFVYAWDRRLDGPDYNLDQLAPDENPGACVVTALDREDADWIIVTNGRLWRLYSRRAHSRATNFYEVDLVEALVASGDTDPNEAFRYWWLFFRAAAFAPANGGGCWLDAVAEGSRDYAKQLGDRLKQRIFETVFPHLAKGLLEDRKRRLGIKRRPTEEELHDAFEATLTLLYRLLFLLYAESRDLLPIREAAYRQASLAQIKTEIADKAGIAETEVDARLTKAYSATETTLYDRLGRLCAAMDDGDAALNVPTYNGGLFKTRPDETAAREHRIARFLLEHKVPDRYLALAVDRLARDPDDKTLALVYIDYKSLEVRHLGSIYEGLLEFKLRVAEEDLGVKSEKGKEKYIPLAEAKPKRGRSAEVVVPKGDVYLSNDKAERKASGSYYTPDSIVEYIVEQTVGPVLAEKLDSLRGELRQVRKTFDNEVAKLKVPPLPAAIRGGEMTEREFAASKTYAVHKRLVDQIFDFRTLDPAMGSGHFLVETVDFITDRVLTFLNQFPVNPVSFMLDQTRDNILTALNDQGVVVDREKLTEVNLLKRHVLKRCIYGVDLNPMAVELAKVSLWLDAFTIGAPLSFLDHHLRCGNSLIGATFRELKGDTKGKLFFVNYDPLLRTIHLVLDINASADATAAEVKSSSAKYDAARKNVKGYQTAFDAIAAESFGVKNAEKFAALVELDLEDFDRQFKLEFRGELGDRLPEIEELAREHTFFHWEIEFPEVFFGFSDADQRQLKHRDEIAAGAAGFDVVIGNPPYVRMELIKPIKPFLKSHYECHAERADLFIYFYERAVKLLRRGGRSAFIASSTWTRTAAGENLRRFLKAETTVVSYLDFGDLPVFPDATTYPCVMVVKQAPAAAGHTIAGAVVPDLESPDLSEILEERRITVPQTELELAGWSFEDRRLARLREKIRDAGVPLKDYCGSPLYGIKTGLNEAFVVDSLTCERLIAEDPKSKEILKPFLEGKDLKPWRYEWRGLWLIYTHHGVEIDRYRAIKAYLSTYRRQLEQRATSENHAWYELQQPQLAYTAKMATTKLIWPQITNRPSFSVDDRSFFINNKIYFLAPDNHAEAYYLAAILNSQTAWFFLTAIATPKMHNYFELTANVIGRIPVPDGKGEDRSAVGRIAKELSNPDSLSRLSLEAELNDRVAALYGLTAEERKMVAGRMPAADSV